MRRRMAGAGPTTAMREKTLQEAVESLLRASGWLYVHVYEMRRTNPGFPDILASLTTNPARRFGYEKTAGRVAPGMEADLVVLDGDPARDIGALARVRYTVRQGRIIFRLP